MNKANQLNKLKEKLNANKTFILLYELHVDYYDKSIGSDWQNRLKASYEPVEFVRIYCWDVDGKPFWSINQHWMKHDHSIQFYPYQLAKDLLKKKIPGEPEYKGTFNYDVILDYCRRILDKYNPNMMFFDREDAMKECGRRNNEAQYRYESKVIQEKLKDANEHIEYCKKSIIETTKRMAEYMDVQKEYEKKRDELKKSGNYYEDYGRNC